MTLNIEDKFDTLSSAHEVIKQHIIVTSRHYRGSMVARD